MLHDIGRFEQVRRYGTFSDAKSIDHAELGADLLFRDGLLDNFIKGCEASELSRWISGRWREIAERAIRLHNKLALPEGLDDTMRTYCELLRDADKADIFRVLSEVPYEDRSAGFPKIEDRDGARDEIMECVLAHKCVPRVSERTKFESLLSQCCMAFELVYPKTRDIVYEQGYLDRLLSSYDETGGIKAKQMQIVRREIVKSWG